MSNGRRPSDAATLRVLVADDEAALRGALTDLLRGEDGFEVVGAAADAAEAIALARAEQPDVALIDVRMPGGGGYAAREIRIVSPETKVIALSAYDDRATVVELLHAGAVGYLVKGVANGEIVEAIRRAMRGQASMSAEMAMEVIEALSADIAERRAAEGVLRRSEEQVRGLIESAPDAVLIVDAEGQIALVNERTEQLFGYRREEMLGRRVELLLPERVRSIHAAHRDGYLHAPHTRPMGTGLELTGRRKDGTEFPADISLSGAQTDEGPLVTAFVRDLSERQSVDVVRREREERFAALLEAAPDAIVVIDEQGGIVLVNKQTEQLFGYAREELVGQTIERLLPEHLRTRHIGHRGAYFADPRTRPMGIDLELAGRRKDGSEFPVDISLSALETSDGRLATAYIRDVSERRSVEELRRSTEQRFAALLESAPDGIVISDDAGRIVLVNEQVEKLFQYKRAELVGKPIEILLPERARERHAAHRQGYLSAPVTRPMGAGLELAGRRKDGSEFPVDISLSSVETDQGRLATAFVRDITERTAEVAEQRSLAERHALARQIVRASEEERRRIAGDIHDDSIQAITAAGMRLQILRRVLTETRDIALLDELEGTIQLSIARLRHLLFDLRPPALDKEGLSEALRIYLDEVGKDTDTRYRLEDRLGTQPDDETRLILYRIAKEALANVSKHAQAGKAQVTLEDRDQGFHVRVTDDGIGFPPEEPSAPAPGHLGLATMRERAEMVGGWFAVESSPNAGTTVEFWVPALSQTEAA